MKCVFSHMYPIYHTQLVLSKYIATRLPLTTKCALSKNIQEFHDCNLLNTSKCYGNITNFIPCHLRPNTKFSNYLYLITMGVRIRFLPFFGVLQFIKPKRRKFAYMMCLQKQIYEEKLKLKFQTYIPSLFLNKGNMKPRDVLSISVHCTCFQHRYQIYKFIKCISYHLFLILLKCLYSLQARLYLIYLEKNIYTENNK